MPTRNNIYMSKLTEQEKEESIEEYLEAFLDDVKNGRLVRL